jgi:hypothetical protein
MAILLKGKKGAKPQTVEAGAVVFGTRSTCTLEVDDPMVAERHCSFIEEAGAWYVEDLGTSSGTYINGVALEGRTLLPTSAPSSIVIGVSRINAEIDAEKGLLTLTLKEQSFYYDKKEDPLEWSRFEVTLGRFLPVRLGNWVAIGVVALLFAVIWFDAIEEPLVDPGPLADVHTAAFMQEHAPAHAARLAAAGMAPGDCKVCHEGWTGTPPTRCEPCHEDIVRAPTHPPSWEGLSCQPCHVDHRGLDRLSLTAVRPQDTCGDCHDPDLEPALPVPPRKDASWVRLAYVTFPHRAHLSEDARRQGVLGCETCHVKRSDPIPADYAAGQPEREFEPVAYDKCIECHKPGAENPDIAWTVDWHGADDDGGAHCLSCHGELHQEALVQVPRIPRGDPSPLLFGHTFVPRDHHPELTAIQATDELACTPCHRDGVVGGPPELRDRPFLHGVHLSATMPGEDREMLQRIDGECRQCHLEVLEGPGASALTAGHYQGPSSPQTSCLPCHETPPAPTPRLPLPASVLTNQFPHGLHLDTSKPGLERGCLSCHDIPAGLREEHVPTTRPEARSCTPCHENHKHVGGGTCDRCHGPDDPVYTAQPVPREWPEPNGFDHGSRGHVSERCEVCHIGTETSESLLNLQIPAESDASCRDCHIKKKARFHWR